MMDVMERNDPGLTILANQKRVHLPHALVQCSSYSVESGAHQKSYRTVILNSGNHVRVFLPKLRLPVYLFDEPHTYNGENCTLALDVKRLDVFWEVTQGRQVFQVHSGCCLPSRETCVRNVANGSVSGARAHHTGPEDVGETSVLL